MRCTVPVKISTLYNYQQYPVHSPCHKLHTVQLSTISGAQSLSQAPHCTIINNIRCTFPVTSSTLYIYQQHLVHGPCHKLHTVQLSTISGARSLTQAPHCTIINNIRCTVPVTSSKLHNYQQYPVHSPCHKLHTVQLSTISGAHYLTQAPHCTIVNNIRCTVPVTSSTLYNYQQYLVHSPCHKLHTVQLSTISGAQSLSQAPNCTVINNIRCTVPVTSSKLYSYQQYPVHSPCHKLHTVQLSTISGAQSLSQAPHCTTLSSCRHLPPPPAHLSLPQSRSIGIKNQIEIITTLNAAQLLH